MLLPLEETVKTPLMSIAMGGKIGTVISPIIDPKTLGVAAYTIHAPTLGRGEHLLRLEDVREYSELGFIIDSVDDIVSPGDVIKLDEIRDLHFNPVKMKVIDDKGRRVGMVKDVIIDLSSFYIQQLRVSVPLFQRMQDTERLIHRSQIAEINNKAIIVHSASLDVGEQAVVRNTQSYINPFRQPTTDQSSDTH